MMEMPKTLEVVDRIRSAVLAGDPDKLHELITGVWDAGRSHGELWCEIALAAWLDKARVIYAGEPTVVEVLGRIVDDIRNKKWRRPEFRSIVDVEEKK